MKPLYIEFDGSLNHHYMGYPAYPEPEEETIKCELCEDEATTQVDIDPICYPGRYMVDLCEACAAFERIRINHEILKP